MENRNMPNCLLAVPADVGNLSVRRVSDISHLNELRNQGRTESIHHDTYCMNFSRFLFFETFGDIKEWCGDSRECFHGSCYLSLLFALDECVL